MPPPTRRGFLARWTRRVIFATIVWVMAYHGLPRLLPVPQPLLKPPPVGQEIVDRSGRPLRRLLADGRRSEPLKFSAIPRELIDATVSAEDQRFWTHGGIDGIGLVRAALDSLVAGRRVSGASTITQQLVKVAFERYTGRTWKDKLREMAYARKLEMTWSKERILTEYLQRVNYGNQATGCAAAASLYFKKPLGDLSLAESAFLAGLPQAPTRLNPYRNFEGAKKRQEWILSRMREDGRLTPGQAAAAAAETLRLRRWTGGFEAPHFVDMLLAEGLAQPETPAASELDGDSAPPAPLRTTLDLELQQFGERTVRGALARLESRQARHAALVVIDNRTGGVRALVGSPDFAASDAGQVNGVIAPRSAGSTLKPFTYLLALQQGDTPSTIVDDLPTEFMTPTGLYAPQNYDRRHYGPMTYREALANSLNLAALRVLERIGGPEVLHGALCSLGLTTLNRKPDEYGLGLTLGNAEVCLLELANAYACLARLGEWQPVALLANAEVSDSVPPSERRQRLDPAACWLIADMLGDANARARCFGLDSPLRLAFPAAVKTGTSTDFRDNWCVGFTRLFTVGVWVGNFDHRPMDRVTGVSGAAPIWRDVMNWLEHRHGAGWPERPASLVEVDVDPLTGERVPEKWIGKRPTVRDWCSLSAVPPVAPDDRYDTLGRVVLPREYARWIRGGENWLGSSEVVLGTAIRREAGPDLRITSPLAGSTVILDPDLSQRGSRLPLHANTLVPEPRWTSPTLQIERDGTRAFARLVPGRHEIRLQDPATGSEAVSIFTVRSL